MRARCFGLGTRCSIEKLTQLIPQLDLWKSKTQKPETKTKIIPTSPMFYNRNKIWPRNTKNVEPLRAWTCQNVGASAHLEWPHASSQWNAWTCSFCLCGQLPVHEGKHRDVRRGLTDNMKPDVVLSGKTQWSLLQQLWKMTMPWKVMLYIRTLGAPPCQRPTWDSSRWDCGSWLSRPSLQNERTRQLDLQYLHFFGRVKRHGAKRFSNDDLGMWHMNETNLSVSSLCLMSRMSASSGSSSWSSSPSSGSSSPSSSSFTFSSSSSSSFSIFSFFAALLQGQWVNGLESSCQWENQKTTFDQWENQKTTKQTDTTNTLGVMNHQC